MDANNPSPPIDEENPRGVAGSQHWSTQLNDALGGFSDNNFLNFHTPPALRVSHQRAISNSVLNNRPMSSIQGIHNRSSSAHVEQSHLMNRQLQMFGQGPQQLALEQAYQPAQQFALEQAYQPAQQFAMEQAYQPAQQFAFQGMGPSVGFNPYYEEAMAIDPRLWTPPQPNNSAVNNFAAGWNPSLNQNNVPMVRPPNDGDDSQFYNMGTGQFENPSGSLIAVNIDDTAHTNNVNFGSTNYPSMDQASLEDLNTNSQFISLAPAIHSSSPEAFTHFRNLSLDSTVSNMSLDAPVFEPANTGFNEAPPQRLLTDIFPTEITADSMHGLRFQPPPLYVAGESPELPRTPQSRPRGTASMTSTPGAGEFQLPMHPTTILRASMNSSPTRAVTARPRLAPRGSGINLPPPTPVVPGAPVKKRAREDDEETQPAPPKRVRTRAPGSAPVTPSTGLISSPGSAPSTASTPRKPRKPRGTRTAAVAYPKDWDSASVSDMLLFELKNAGSTWAQITETYNRISESTYTTSTLQNRYHGIRRLIGNLPGSTPEEDLPLPACLDGFTVDAHGLHRRKDTTKGKSDQADEGDEGDEGDEAKDKKGDPKK